MNTYKLHISKQNRVMPFVIVGIMTIVGLSMLISQFELKLKFETIFMIVWLGMIFKFWLTLLNIPYEIRIEGSYIQFISIANKDKKILISDLQEIEVNMNWATFKYTGGKINGISSFNNFHQLINQIKETNNSLITKGC